MICVDVDDTICQTTNRDYANSVPIEPMVARLREARALGYHIVLHTARGQGRSNGSWQNVADEVRSEVTAFCERYAIPFDALVLGKPWARWYVDDKAIRPDEFLTVEL